MFMLDSEATVQDVDSDPYQQNVAISNRKERAVRRGGRRGTQRSSGDGSHNSCESIFIGFIAVGAILGTVCLFFIVFELSEKTATMKEKVSFICGSLFDLAVWFTCYGVLLYISSWNDENKKMVPAILTCVFCSIAISVRAIIVCFCWAVYYLKWYDNIIGIF